MELKIENCWNKLFSSQPKLSKFVRKMQREDRRWERVIGAFLLRPAQGVRGVGRKRKEKFVVRDESIRQIYNETLQANVYNPLNYLQRIAHNLGRNH